MRRMNRARRALLTFAACALLLPVSAAAQESTQRREAREDRAQARREVAEGREAALERARRGQRLTGRSIADRIMEELRLDSVISADDLGVVVVDGDVMLSGSLPSLDAKQRAERIAEGVRGVRQVRNSIQVRTERPYTDRQVDMYVEQALEADPATSSADIEVEVRRGVVTLTGTVSSAAERRMAREIASDVFGVRDLRDELTVRALDDTREPSAIEDDIRSTLQWDARVDATDVNVRVDDTTAVLSGTVSSAQEKRRAIEDATVSGVTEVDADKLVVDPDRQRQRPDVRALASEADVPAIKGRLDGAVRAAVGRSLRNHPRLDDADIEIDVDNGVVTLRGDVDSVKAKRTATQLARNNLGVREVKNRLRVDPTIVSESPVSTAERDLEESETPAEARHQARRDAKEAARSRTGDSESTDPVREAETLTDAEIEKAVQSGLRRDPYLSAQRVDVEVVGGAVYLGGEVASLFEKMRADDVAARTRGVTTVHNEIDLGRGGEAQAAARSVTDDEPYYLYEWYEVAPAPTSKSDQEIQAELDDQLFWNPYVDAQDVRVDVDDGFVKLEGTVTSWAEHDAATADAYQAGAISVVNNLEVEGS